MVTADLVGEFLVEFVSDLARSLSQGEKVARIAAGSGVYCLFTDCGIAALTAPDGGGASAAPVRGPWAQDMLCRSADTED
jgi:hypothetical protein